MNSIPIEEIKSSESELKRMFKDQLKKQLVTGMSYGTKAIAQTIKDMINIHTKNSSDITDIASLSSEQKDELLNAIVHFINTTVDATASEVTQAISNKID